ncbi:MAG: acyl-CoA dehydrogenase family protein [Desulfomonilia bacterium]|jgi:acyl-CoA dehydrogenase|uniref:Acyl-CoA dehydrogenase n=1 Tax=anaerobic digester metagenome TaxID=1263854 RepID=A0A485M1G2_9ZZZZ|nr:acyl-CoA dehydrogenase family protein [Pseudomonadota bacterium]HON38782.1 acyl-CoA dehydrogenase family protein [Deltaproteobacteria bacterium]HRS56659.1 acyl-CoA dehydrogenase family protein [Desulfomonilia bacterium]HPD20276.1 acyl-CoA dehydrogenase family protein [Deltaproteobacteria bacterium]HPX17661.1 acyl-CoA dehydrogenase family protein [Deltaproteobacteria bacterium]
MDFEIPDKIKAITDMIDEFVDKELIPMEREFLGKDFRAMLPALQEKREMVKKMELWAPNHPKEYGGMGLNLVEHAFVSESLGRTPIGHYVFGCQAPDAGNIEILHLHGTEEQKEKYLRPLVEGKIRSCFSMTEVEMPGSNPVMMETTAVKDGDDYVINGQKWYSSSSDGAEFAIVMAVTNPDAPTYLKASMIIVPCNTPGFNQVRNIPVMGEPGTDYTGHGEILYQNCRVPQKNLLGPEGHGFVIAQERLGPGRIHHCMRWIGICKRCFDLMCSRASKRVISPNGKTLATRQIIQAWISECAANIQAARLMILNTAWKMEKYGNKVARQDVSMIKFFTANVMQDVIDKALQVHGGLGMTDDIIIPFFYRHERAARIYDGADEVHKVSLARRILKEYEGREIR